MKATGGHAAGRTAQSQASLTFRPDIENDDEVCGQANAAASW